MGIGLVRATQFRHGKPAADIWTLPDPHWKPSLQGLV